MCEIALLSLILDLYFPISPLISPFSLFGAHTGVEKDDEYPGIQSTCAGGAFFFQALLPHTHAVYTHIQTEFGAVRINEPKRCSAHLKTLRVLHNGFKLQTFNWMLCHSSASLHYVLLQQHKCYLLTD